MGMVTFSFFYGSFGRIIRPWKKNKKKQGDGISKVGWYIRNNTVLKKSRQNTYELFSGASPINHSINTTALAGPARILVRDKDRSSIRILVFTSCVCFLAYFSFSLLLVTYKFIISLPRSLSHSRSFRTMRRN